MIPGNGSSWPPSGDCTADDPLFQNLPVAALLVQQRHGEPWVEQANAAAARLLGVADPLRLCGPALRLLCADGLAPLLEGAGRAEGLVRLARSWRWLLARAARMGQGRVLLCLQERPAPDRCVALTTEQPACLFESLPVALVAWKRTGAGYVVRQANAAARRLLDPAQVSPGAGDLETLSTAQLRPVFDRCLATGESCALCLLVPGLSGVRRLAVNLAVLPAGLLVLHAEDLSQQYVMQAELLAATRAAQGANRAKSQFLANMSHEIRTPMNAVIGFTELTLEHELPPHLRRNLEMALESARSLLSIMNDILDYSKIEADRLDLEERPFALRRLLGTIIQEQSLSAEEKGLSLRLAIAPGLPEMLRGDPGRLRQVLANLLHNAVKFTQAGSVRVEARPGVPDASLPQGVRWVEFAVADTGVGIAADKQAMIFDRFTQVDSSLTKEFAGTGLGLAICRKLCRAMGGDIRVQSEPGRGSVFSFSVPLAAAPQEPAKPEGKTSGLRVEPLSILLAEDNPINQAYATLLLESRGHRVRCAANGQEALEALAQGGVDVVLMDVQMPVLDGLAATRRIRQGQVAGVAANFPVIGLSAYAMAGDCERFLAAGMDVYLTKPIDARALEVALAQVLPQRAIPERHGPVAGPAVNVDALCNRYGGHQELLREIVGIFLEEAPPRLAAMARGLGEGDGLGVAAMAHQLAGSAATLGADVLRRMCLDLESVLRNGRPDSARDLLGAVEAECLRVMAELRAAVAG